MFVLKLFKCVIKTTTVKTGANIVSCSNLLGSMSPLLLKKKRLRKVLLKDPVYIFNFVALLKNFCPYCAVKNK